MHQCGGTSSSHLFNLLTDISEGRSNASGEASLLLFDVFKFRPTKDVYVTLSFASFLSVCVFGVLCCTYRPLSQGQILFVSQCVSVSL